MAGPAILIAARTAGAAGDAGLDSHIVADPVSGWQNQPRSDVQRFVTYVNALESRTVTPQGGSAQTAAEGWRNPKIPGDYLVIALVALSYPGQSAAQTAGSASRAAATALASLCAGAPSRSAVQTVTVTGVPGGHEITCTLSAGGPGPDALGWTRGNVVTLLVTVNGLFAHSSLATVAREQYQDVPPNGVALPPPDGGGGSGIPTWLIAVVAVLAMGAGAYWVLVISPRRQRQPRARREPEPADATTG
jgi:hypothetical protein